MKKVIAWALTVLLSVLGFIGLSFATIVPASAAIPEFISYCQATSSATNPYVYIKNAPLKALINDDGTFKQGGINANDIVPAFSWDFGGDSHGEFAGQNWTLGIDSNFIDVSKCSAGLNELTPPVPTFEPATCANLTGTVSHNNTDARITVAGPTLTGNTWTVSYDKITDTRYNTYTFVEDAVLTYTFDVLEPVNDPLWDSELKACRMPDTGLFGLSDEATFLGGGLLALGVLFVLGNAATRRRTA